MKNGSIDNNVVSEHINYLIKYCKTNYPKNYFDVVKSLFALKDMNDIDFCKRVNFAYLFAKNMYASVEDIVCVLLSLSVKLKYISYNDFDKYFNNSADIYWNRIGLANNSTENNSDVFIMTQICDNLFSRLVKIMYKQKHNGIDTVKKAYSYAKEAHKGVTRKSGEIYLIHPLMVAFTLVEQNMDSSIITAALLHDVVEDTKITLSDVECRFNSKIKKLVNAVTSLHKEVYSAATLSNESYDKKELDEKSFIKLRNIVSSDINMRGALFIKAADRINNLYTLDAMPENKITAKIDETDRWYLPLFKEFGLNYFVRIIDNEEYKYHNAEKYTEIKLAYDRLKSEWQSNFYCNNNYEDMEDLYVHPVIDVVKSVLNENFNKHISLIDDCDFRFEFKEREVLPYEILNVLSNDKISEHIFDYKEINKHNIYLCNYDIIIDTPMNLDNDIIWACFLNAFCPLIESETKWRNISVCSIEVKDFHLDILIEDEYRNKIRLVIWSREYYVEHMYGISKEETEKLSSIRKPTKIKKNKTIVVKLKNGKNHYIDDGATVLDLAFDIHEDIGLCATGAMINGHMVSLETKLRNNDKVVISTDSDKENIHARINWLRYLHTYDAKKSLIRYLELKYEGDDPNEKTSINDSSLENALNNLLAQINLGGE